MDERILWRQRWLSSINELTSLQLQQKSWLDRNNTNPHWSFIEFVECYIDDTLGGQDYAYFLDLGWVSEDEYDFVKVWHDSLRAYEPPANNYYDHDAILKDSEWIEIVHLGEIAKQRLVTMLPEEEKKVLSEKIDYTAYL